MESVPSCSSDNVKTAISAKVFVRQCHCRAREGRKTAVALVRVWNKKLLHLPELWSLKDGVWKKQQKVIIADKL